MTHLHLNELLLIRDMWLNKITYLLTYLLTYVNSPLRRHVVNSKVLNTERLKKIKGKRETLASGLPC